MDGHVSTLTSMNSPNGTVPLTTARIPPEVVPEASPGVPQSDTISEGPRGKSGKEAATRVIAVLNQKGGVGKTTTTVNLGAALAGFGRRVLLVDLDPQAHLTLHLGLNPEQLDKTVYDLLTDPNVSAGEVVIEVKKKLFVLPAEVNLAGVESELAGLMAAGQAQRVLLDKCGPLIRDGRWFDYVLIDCPPSLGLLTLNALVMATEVFVPMQAHFLALQGLSKLLETVSWVKQSLNDRLLVTGIVLCMHEGQTVLAAEVTADLKAFLDSAKEMDVPWRHAEILQPAIRRNIKLAESPSFGKAILDYAPTCPGAADYIALAQSVIRRRVTTSGVNGQRTK